MHEFMQRNAFREMQVKHDALLLVFAQIAHVFSVAARVEDWL